MHVKTNDYGPGKCKLQGSGTAGCRLKAGRVDSDPDLSLEGQVRRAGGRVQLTVERLKALLGEELEGCRVGRGGWEQSRMTLAVGRTSSCLVRIVSHAPSLCSLLRSLLRSLRPSLALSLSLPLSLSHFSLL